MCFELVLWYTCDWCFSVGWEATGKTLGVFHLPKTFGNFHGKVHRVRNVFHLTLVQFV